jgi:hypothetical protein
MQPPVQLFQYATESTWSTLIAVSSGQQVATSPGGDTADIREREELPDTVDRKLLSLMNPRLA